MGSFARAAAIVAFGLACAALGAWWNGGDAAPPAAAPAESSTRCLTGEDRLALRRELADDVRRAVAAAMPAPAATTTAVAAKTVAQPDAVATEAPVPSPGHDAARQIVASAVVRGSWRPEDAQEFREVLGGLTHDETVEVLDELSRAINTGRLHVIARDRPTF